MLRLPERRMILRPDRPVQPFRFDGPRVPSEKQLSLGTTFLRNAQLLPRRNLHCYFSLPSSGLVIQCFSRTGSGSSWNAPESVEGNEMGAPERTFLGSAAYCSTRS